MTLLKRVFQIFSRISETAGEMRFFGPYGAHAALSLMVVYVYLLATLLLPLQSSQTDLHLHPPNLTLINLDQFQFLVNQDQCADSPISLLVLIHSAPGNWMVRQAIRNSWGRYHLLIGHDPNFQASNSWRECRPCFLAWETS